MKKKEIAKILILAVITVGYVFSCGKSYARYVLTKQSETTFSAEPFYFEVERSYLCKEKSSC